MTNTEEQDTEGFYIGVEEVEEHEDGSATYQFHISPEAKDSLADIGTEFVLVCAAYGWDMADALKSLEREVEPSD